jgi:MoxR-like ATPase
MRFSHIKTSVLEQFKAPQGNKIVPFILGAPGGGKSAVARDIVSSLGIEQSKVIEFTASLRDPVDVLGVPDVSGDYTRWVPPQEFFQIRKGQGPCALILEELSDAPVPMQNALCGVIYDRRAGQLQLSPDLFIIATGNRTLVASLLLPKPCRTMMHGRGPPS